jgi:hypothetical protein
VTLFLSGLCFGQSIEDGWKGILPFKTDIATVQKLLGQPEIDENGYHGYSGVDAFVQVNYSSEPCREDPKHPGLHRGKYNLPKGVVLDYRVVLRKTIAMPDLKLDLKKYYRETGYHVRDLAYYFEYIEGTRKTSNQNGVSIAVSVQNEIENVSSITYYPREAEKKAAACKGVKP